MKKKILSWCLLSAALCASAQVVTVGGTGSSSTESDNSAFTFTESQLGEDDDAVQSVTALTSSSSDMYLSEVGYLFSPMRFKVRALDSKYNDVYINGVMMNDVETGRFSYGMIGGLNDATRNQEGAGAYETTRWAYVPVGGASNINMRASQYATGSKAVISACNRNYLARTMFTHSTGMMENGWAFTMSASYRWANEGVIEGTFYNAFGLFLAAQKKLNDAHSLNLAVWGTPTERAQQGAATEEAYALAGSHYYNPYWGYQDGKKRNARVVNSFEPTAVLTWDYTIDEASKLVTSLSFKHSSYSTTALGWNGNAADPRPDYYKKLPSSAFNVWDLTHTPTADELASYNEIYDTFSGSPAGRQINWDQLYFANQQANAAGGEALYYVEARHNDQRALNLSSVYSRNLNSFQRVNGGVALNTTKGLHYKTMSDLLGANKYTDIDKFAARDNGYGSDMIQNDLNHPNRLIMEGDVFGYNYNIYVNKARAFGQYQYNNGTLAAHASAFVSGTTIEREGLMRNGRAADRSYGSSGTAWFIGGGAKGGVAWRPNASHTLSLNATWQTDAPLAYNAFVANRIKNDFVHGLRNEDVMGAEASYKATIGHFMGQVTGYYNKFMHGVEQTAFYNDAEARFSYLSMNEVERVHYGVEFALKYNVTSALSFNAIGNVGDAYYGNNPLATLTYEDQDSYLNSFTNPVTKKAEDMRVLAKGCRVGSTPLTALSVGVDYNVNGWFLGANVNYYDNVYVSFSQYLRLSSFMDKYVAIGTEDGAPVFEDGAFTVAQLEKDGGILYNQDGTVYRTYTPAQPKCKGGFMADVNVGRYLRLKNGRSLSLNLTVNNLLNNQKMCTGGYEQNRDDHYWNEGAEGELRTYSFSRNPKIYYANAFNAFFNVGYKF